LSRRFKTLFIPFILWNLIVLSGLAVAQSIPSLATYFSGNFYGFIRTFSLFDYFVVVIIVCIYSYKYLARYMPVVSSILTGGRVQPPEPVMGSGFAKVILSESARKL